MTHIFQPLDLTVNRLAKSFFKRKFTEWYSNEIKLQLETGTTFDDIEVELTLTTLKPMHLTSIIYMVYTIFFSQKVGQCRTMKDKGIFAGQFQP